MIGVADLAERAEDEERRQRETHARALELADRAFDEARRANLEREGVRARAAEAQRARDRLRAALDLSAHRKELERGEPCPLCGSLDHPYAHGAPFDELLLEEDARAAELAALLSQVEARLAQSEHEVSIQRTAAIAAASEAARWSRELDGLRARYADAARALGPAAGAWPAELGSAAVDWGPLFASEPGVLLDARARRALYAARDAAARTAELLEAEERARRDRERSAASLRERHESARELAAIGARELERCTSAEQALERDHARLGRERDDLREARAEHERSLADAMRGYEGWTARLATLLDEVRADVAARREHIDARAQAQARARESLPALEAARAEERARSRAELDARAEHEREAARTAELSARRTCDPDALERSLAADLDRARADKDRALHAREAAVRAAAEHEAASVERERAAIEARDEHERARAALELALSVVGLDEEGARARLARDPRAIDAWRAELGRLDEARARCEAVLTERAQRRAAHEADDPPNIDAAQAHEALGAAQRALIETREVLYATRLRLDQDDTQRARAASLATELAERREKLAVWETLADLVGSANGAKLRVFAQSLTLELLLEHANHHLADLAPRYLLARVPGEDLALQVVDREMGDEVRSIGSLSGGETFLAALAMALGLASLGSHRAHVGSLFIDEGFGALDPTSLDVVLAALDALHASGRQVGLISHVPTIAERFGTRVHVTPAGPAKSRVELIGG
jgi:exonuclease SbcC